MVDYAIILAVGNPAHRSQLTYNRACAMLPALGKPLVVQVMNPLYRLGIRKYVLVVGISEGAVASYLNHNWVPDAEIEFVLKSDTVSIVKTLSEIVRRYQEPFLITSYNSFTHAQFPDRLSRKHNDTPNALILSGANTTLSTSQKRHFALIEQETVKAIVSQVPEGAEALTLTDIAFCGHDFVDYLTNAQIQTGNFHHQLIDIFAQFVATNGDTRIAETAWTLQVETDKDLLKLNHLLLDQGQDAHILSEPPPTVQIIPPVRIDPQVSIGQGAKIGPYVYLESGSNIGYEATVQNSIVLQQAKVPSGTSITNAIISTRGQIV